MRFEPSDEHEEDTIVTEDKVVDVDEDSMGCDSRMDTEDITLECNSKTDDGADDDDDDEWYAEEDEEEKADKGDGIDADVPTAAFVIATRAISCHCKDLYGFAQEKKKVLRREVITVSDNSQEKKACGFTSWF